MLAFGPENIVLQRKGVGCFHVGVRVGAHPADRGVGAGEVDVRHGGAGNTRRQTRQTGFLRIIPVCRIVHQGDVDTAHGVTELIDDSGAEHIGIVDLRSSGVLFHEPGLGVGERQGVGAGRKAAGEIGGVAARAVESEEAVLVREIHVHFAGEVVDVHLDRQLGQIIVLNVAVGGVRQIRLQGESGFRKPAGGDGVVRERLPGGGGGAAVGCRGGVVDQRGQGAEVALPEVRRGNGLQGGNGGRNVTVAVIVGEEEDFVPADRSARAAAELVLVLDGGSGREEAARVEIGVAQVFVDRAVELIPAGLQHEVADALAFIHGLRAVGFHLELLHGLDRDAEREVARIALGAGVGHRETFDIDFVLVGLAAVKRAGGGSGDLRAVGADAGHQTGELGGIAGDAVHGQGQRVVNLVVDGAAEGGVVGMELRGRVVDGDGFAGGAELEFEGEADGGKRVHHDVFLRERLEPLGGDADPVAAGGEQRQDNESSTGGFADRGHPGGGVGRGHGGFGDGGSRGVRNGALDGAGATDLRGSGHAENDCDQSGEKVRGVAHVL